MPLCAIIAFVAMILACTSSSSSLNSTLNGGSEAGGTADDSAMLTDSVASPFDDLAAL